MEQAIFFFFKLRRATFYNSCPKLIIADEAISLLNFSRQSCLASWVINGSVVSGLAKVFFSFFSFHPLFFPF